MANITNRLKRVDLPIPLFPTIKVSFPGYISRLKFWKIGLFFLL